MANCQNNMRCMRRPVHPAAPSREETRRMDGCPDTHDHFPAGMPVAMAYVPWQKWQRIYELGQGLEHGTIFEELDKPFLGKGGPRR